MAVNIVFVIAILLNLGRVDAQAKVKTSTASINLTDPTGTYIDKLTDLETKLLQNYNRLVRPVKNDTTRTTIKFYCVIQHIEEIDEVEQAVTVHGFMYWEWKDEYMVWDKNAYNGVDRFTLHGWYLWKPDIVLYNTGSGAENNRRVNQYQHVWVQSDGTIMYFPFFSFRATCIFDFTSYPYDVQTCPLILGSWSFTLRELEIIPFGPQAGIVLAWNASKSIVSGWELTSSRMNVTYWNAMNKRRNDSKPPEDEYYQSFTEVNVWLQLKRHAPYFGVIVLLPAVMSSLFTLASFWTVATVHGITVLLINVIVQSVFTDDLLQKIPPSTGGTPRIVLYYAFNLTATVLAILLLMVLKTVENLRQDTKRPVPNMLAVMVRMAAVSGRGRAQESEQMDDPVPNDDEEDEANRQQGGKSAAGPAETSATQSETGWPQVADLLKKLCFAVYTILYLSFMFAWLC